MYTECPADPEHWPGMLNIFLAGGITNCPDWQKEFAIEHDYINWINPRRADFDVDNLVMGVEQINWEYRNLRNADVIVFWFPKETLCPITLFELGAALERDAQIYIGTDKEYARRLDVIVQARLAGYDEEIHDSLDGLLSDVLQWELETRL